MASKWDWILPLGLGASALIIAYKISGGLSTGLQNIGTGVGTGFEELLGGFGNVGTGLGGGLFDLGAGLGGGLYQVGGGAGNFLSGSAIDQIINALYGKNPQPVYTSPNVPFAQYNTNTTTAPNVNTTNQPSTYSTNASTNYQTGGSGGAGVKAVKTIASNVNMNTGTITLPNVSVPLPPANANIKLSPSNPFGFLQPIANTVLNK